MSNLPHHSCSSYSWVDLELTNIWKGTVVCIWMSPLCKEIVEQNACAGGTLPRGNWALVSLVLESDLAKSGGGKGGGIAFPDDGTLKQT